MLALQLVDVSNWPIKGPLGNVYNGVLPTRMKLVHPSVVDGLRAITVANNYYIAMSDMFRSPASSLAARQQKSGVQRPGFSGHNYGISIDIDIDQSVKLMGMSYPDLVRWMATKGWTCYRSDYQLGPECIAEGSLVSTRRGLVPIEDLQVGEQLHTAYGWRYLVAKVSKGQRQTFVVTTDKGFAVVATTEHPVMVLTPDLRLAFKSVSMLQVGDVLVSPKIGYGGGTVSLAQAVETAHAWYASHNQRATPPKFPTRMSTDLALLLGFMSSEGWHNDHTVGFYNLSLATKRRFCDALYRVFGIAKNPLPDKDIESGIRSLGIFLDAIGLSQAKAADKCVPWSILQADRACKLMYIRGCIEGDGTVRSSHRYLNISSISFDLIQGLHLLLLSMGIVSRVRREATKSGGTIAGRQIKGRGFIWKVRVTGLDAVQLQEETGILRKRLKEVWKRGSYREHAPRHDLLPFVGNAVQEMRHKKKQNNKGYYLCDDGKVRRVSFRLWTSKGQPYCPTVAKMEWHRHNVKVLLPSIRLLDSELADRIDVLVVSDFLFDTVVSIQQAEKQSVWDLSIETKRPTEEPHFFANGIYVHNCWHFNYLSMGPNPPPRSDGPIQWITNTYGSQMTGDEKWVQICLQQLKLYDGAIDGQFGPKSQIALKQFELMYQLPPTGVIDQINCWSLAIATCTKNIIPATP